ncbi:MULTISPECIES: 2-keto-4-pentenoate hydratase [unclassified Novosphingobium]|uniref:2-keto-4-pentenoate hydratase n=1 Tax=unclassified Novosphingobium TaxID=2644732 RepID=UPI00135C870A|nr:MULTISPECIES: fumarylacetoacetate hydrolase family protein [unclassified Novosphingobium]
MSKIDTAAQRLRNAYTQGAIAPLRDTLDPTDADGAYAIQAVNTRFWEAMGRRIVGRKVGLTAKAVQTQLGVDQPDFGVLFADMDVPNGGNVSPSTLLQPKAEAEIAVIIGADLPAREISEAEMVAAISEAAAAIEIVDSRIADWNITFADTVADNGSSALFVLGEERRSLEGLDLWSCGMVLERNGEVASLGAGAACLGHPIKAATWLANTLAARGEPLRKGDIILTGALGPMVPLFSGDEIKVTIGGLGTVSFSYKD